MIGGLTRGFLLAALVGSATCFTGLQTGPFLRSGVSAAASRRVPFAAVAPVIKSRRAATMADKNLNIHMTAGSDVANDMRIELTLGELVKTLISTCKIATLATTMPLRVDDDGVHRFGPQSPGTVQKWEKDGKEYPFGTLVSYLLSPEGMPVMLLANNAAHSRNIASNNKVALYVQNPESTGQKGARATLVGEIEKIGPGEELEECKEAYADVFPDQAQPLLDERYERYFSMYKLNIKDIYYVSGFGVMSTWVTPPEYTAAEADPLAEFSSNLIEGWNKKCLKEYASVAKAFFMDEVGGEISEPRITFVDRFGVNFRFKFAIETPAGQAPKFDTREYRIAFRNQAVNREEAQSSMFKVFQEAWERNEGYADSEDSGSRLRLLLKRDGSTPETIGPA